MFGYYKCKKIRCVHQRKLNTGDTKYDFQFDAATDTSKMIIFYRRSGVAITTSGTPIYAYANMKPSMTSDASVKAGVGVTPMTITIPIYTGAMQLGVAVSSAIIMMALF